MKVGDKVIVDRLVIPGKTFKLVGPSKAGNYRVDDPEDGPVWYTPEELDRYFGGRRARRRCVR